MIYQLVLQYVRLPSSMLLILDAIDAIVYFDLQQGTRGLGIRNPKKLSTFFPVFPGGKLAEQISNCSSPQDQITRRIRKKI